jgi:MoaA/NifB/PqqE/SkfB family radical SAM enzyme
METSNKFKITWLPLWNCNFRCHYCFGWTNTNALEIQPLANLIKVWDSFFHKIQKTETEIELIISGGEPTIYPNFFELMQYFTTKFFRINIYICTNLSFNVHDFLNLKIPNNKILFNITFHPACISLDNFINNLIPVKEYIAYNTISFVADKDNLKKQENFIKKINNYGIKVNPLNLKFTHKNIIREENLQKKEYGNLEVLNSKQEINLIKEIRDKQNLASSDYENSKQSSFGKKCLAGYKYIQIFPNGNIRKCSMDSTYLGNLFDEDIQLYTEPHRCKQEICPNQYHNIIED